MKASNAILISAILATISILIGTITTTVYASTLVIPKNSITTQDPIASEDPSNSDEPASSSPTVSPPTVTGTHDFTGLPLTAAGWTDFKAMFAHPDHYNDSRVIYVSSSTGNNGTAQRYSINDQAVGADPLNPSGAIQPYATLEAGYNQLRDGYPDFLLLKRGDVWKENLPEWRKSGRSQAELMIVGSYGSLSSDRPKIGTFRTSWGKTYPERGFSHTFLVGIEFGYINRQIAGDNFFIEDCATKKGPNTGMRISGSGGLLRNVVVRRSVIAERYPTDSTGHTQGIYSSGTADILLEENIFDHNGWTSNPNEGNPATIHNHNTYFDIRVKNAVMRYNISSRSSSKGFQPGGGGLIKANLSVNDPIGIESSRSENYVPEGLDSVIKDNVFLEGWDSKSSSTTRWGIMLNNVSSSRIEDNIIGSVTNGGGRSAILFWINERNGTWMHIRNVALKDNIIHNWGASVRIVGKAEASDSGGIENVLVQGNAIHNELSSSLITYSPETAAEITSNNNTFFADRDNEAWLADYKTAVGDTDSVINRTTPSGGYLVPDYLRSIGETATLEAFYARIQQQRRGNWDDRYTAVPIINFVRDKFGKDQIKRVYSKE